MSECEGNSVGVGFVVLGLGLAVLASVGSTFGLLLQKLAQVEQDRLPEDEKYKTSGALIFSPTWIAGLVLLVAVPLPLDLIAFSLAPHSLVVPITGVTLILNQVIAPCILREQVTLTDWVATAIITAGIVCCTAFGTHCSYGYSVGEMISFFENLAFLIAEGVFAVTMLFALWWTQCGAQMCRPDPEVSSSLAIAYAYMAGAIGGQMQLLLKATGEVLEASINGNSEFDRWEVYVFIAGCVFFAVAQIQLLNKGLALWSAVKYLPIYNVCLILCSTAFGTIFYQEYDDLTLLGTIMFPTGVMIVVFGTWLLTWKDVDEATATVVPEVKLEVEIGCDECSKDSGQKCATELTCIDLT